MWTNAWLLKVSVLLIWLIFGFTSAFLVDSKSSFFLILARLQVSCDRRAFPLVLSLLLLLPLMHAEFLLLLLNLGRFWFPQAQTEVLLLVTELLMERTSSSSLTCCCWRSRRTKWDEVSHKENMFQVQPSAKLQRTIRLRINHSGTHKSLKLVKVRKNEVTSVCGCCPH